MKKFLALCWVPLTFSFVACGDDTGSGGAGGSGTTTAQSTTAQGSTTSVGTTSVGSTASSTSATTGAGGAAAFDLTSSAFGEGQMIPQAQECPNGGGQNISPPLSWGPGPAGTLSYAVVMRDLDFQNGFLHWVIWDIPGNVTALPAGVEGVYQPSVPAGAKQAPFNGGTVGYFGPCSPNSVNTYEWTVYAIDTAALGGLGQMSTKVEAAAAIEAAAIASATLSGES